jgi:hypothetical protein
MTTNHTDIQTKHIRVYAYITHLHIEHKIDINIYFYFCPYIYIYILLFIHNSIKVVRQTDIIRRPSDDWWILGSRQCPGILNTQNASKSTRQDVSTAGLGGVPNDFESQTQDLK